MDSGSFLGLDDDLFTEAKDKSTKLDTTAYNAKVCEPQWFEKATPADDGEKMQLGKYTADYAFRCKQYRKALAKYRTTSDLLPPNNQAMFRDIQESICRCHLALNNPSEAIPPAQLLVKSAPNFDQKTTSLNLLAEIYQHTGNRDEEKLALMKSIWLHPLNCDAWMRLSYVLISLFQEEKPLVQNKSTGEKVLCGATERLHLKDTNEDLVAKTVPDYREGDPNVTPHPKSHIIGTSLLRTKILAQHVGHLPLFAKTRYRNIINDMDEKMKEAGIGEDFVNEKLPILYTDVNTEKCNDTPNVPDTELIKMIEEDGFEEKFYQRWFPEAL